MKEQLKKKIYTYFAENEDEVSRRINDFRNWISGHGGIDVYKNVDLFCPDAGKMYFVPKGSGRPDWRASQAPIACITDLARITIEMTPRLLRGILRNADGTIADIDPAGADPDDIPIDLRELSTTEAKKLDREIEKFFRRKGQIQGEKAEAGDGREGSYPMGTGLDYGKQARNVEEVVDGLHGFGGCYLSSLWNSFVSSLPSKLLVIRDEDDSGSWSIEKRLRFDCPSCGATMSERDEDSGTCHGCGRLLKIYASIEIVCENKECKRFGKTINKIEIYHGNDADDDLETFCEDYGTGAEEPEDHCPECKFLGVMRDPVFNEVNDADVHREGAENQNRVGIPADQRPE